MYYGLYIRSETWIIRRIDDENLNSSLLKITTEIIGKTIDTASHRQHLRSFLDYFKIPLFVHFTFEAFFERQQMLLVVALRFSNMIYVS